MSQHLVANDSIIRLSEPEGFFIRIISFRHTANNSCRKWQSLGMLSIHAFYSYWITLGFPPAARQFNASLTSSLPSSFRLIEYG